MADHTHTFDHVSLSRCRVCGVSIEEAVERAQSSGGKAQVDLALELALRERLEERAKKRAEKDRS